MSPTQSRVRLGALDSPALRLRPCPWTPEMARQWRNSHEPRTSVGVPAAADAMTISVDLGAR